MIASILTIPQTGNPQGDALFTRFVKEADGVVNAYSLEGNGETVVVTIWVSAEKRDAYMGTQLRRDVDTQFSNGTRKVYTVRNLG